MHQNLCCWNGSTFEFCFFFTSRIDSFLSVGLVLCVPLHPSFYSCEGIFFTLSFFLFATIFMPSLWRQTFQHAFTHTQAFSEISGIITMFYVVRALSPYTEYEFYVIAVNNIGRGPPSIPATTTTGETGKNRCSFTARHSVTLCKCNALSVVARHQWHTVCALLANTPTHTHTNDIIYSSLIGLFKFSRFHNLIFINIRHHYVYASILCCVTGCYCRLSWTEASLNLQWKFTNFSKMMEKIIAFCNCFDFFRVNIENE